MQSQQRAAGGGLAQQTERSARGVAGAMGRLDAREQHIIRVRIMGDGKTTLRDLGKHFGFSRERARQLEIRGLEKLRRKLRRWAGRPGAGA